MSNENDINNRILEDDIFNKDIESKPSMKEKTLSVIKVLCEECDDFNIKKLKLAETLDIIWTYTYFVLNKNSLESIDFIKKIKKEINKKYKQYKEEGLI